MGLFSFAAKVGILAYAYNWATCDRSENAEERNAKAEAKRLEWARKWDEALTTMTDATSSDEKVREWSNHFQSHFRRYEDNCGTIRHPRSWVERGSDSDYTLVVEVPGLKKDDLKIASIDESHQISVKGMTRPIIPTVSRKSEDGENVMSRQVREPCVRKVDAKVFVPTLADIKNAKFATL
ncbi:hypothetical protein BJ742DRAFT_745646 [Cladochytrium replicatum]|nr:hypothetical protein BJ742DRAFT_745646 [Cladochytrium replicatum]